jgi:hypothetical protein
MKKMTAVLLTMMLVSGVTYAEERQAPPTAHFTTAGMLAVVAVAHYDRAVKYQERADTHGSNSDRSKAQRMKFRAGLFTAAAGCFLVTGGIRLVLDDGLVGVRKEVRF